MKKRDLLLNPYWKAEDLGQAIPNTPHAVSVALPRWEDVIAYEEKETTCIELLQSVYPRFGLNPLVREIAQKAIETYGSKGTSAWPYPNIATAKKAKRYSEKTTNNSEGRIKEIAGLHCLIVNEEGTPSAKAFWQHTGLGASSREAAIALNKEPKPLIGEAIEAKENIRNRLATIYGCPSDLIHLHPSGMAALETALESLKKFSSAKSTFQLGFPYVDVLKLPQAIFNGSNLILDTNAKFLESELDQKKPSAVIVELPSNPMLQCIDLPLISKLAHARGIPVIADDTIGSAINIDPIPYADLIFSSLTKSFAGSGDIMGGSLVISPYSHWKDILKEIIPSSCVTELSNPDAIALNKSSKDVVFRVKQLNKTCIKLLRHLEKHPNVETVLHPSNCSNFKSLMRANAGFGCLLSFKLVGGIEKAKIFYDALKVCKGPSLGTNFTLACPYVLLAHYHELDWADKCGVPADLLRVSVGLEDSEELWERFKEALQA